MITLRSNSYITGETLTIRRPKQCLAIGLLRASESQVAWLRARARAVALGLKGFRVCGRALGAGLMLG